MANLNGFDASQVDPATSLDPIPAGKYVAAITGSEMKPTKSNSGSYLELTFTVLEGEHKGRTQWARLNLNNPNDTAVKIARAELSAICRAVGVMQPRDSVELHNLPLLITVKLKKRDDNGELTNEIKAYEAKSSGHAAQPAPTAAEQPQHQASAPAGAPPWQR